MCLELDFVDQNLWESVDRAYEQAHIQSGEFFHQNVFENAYQVETPVGI